MKDYNIVFDLDNVIILPLDIQCEAQVKLIHEKLGKAFFDNNHVIANNFPHMIYPFFDLLLDWLHSQNCRISFFSSGIRTRNEEIIPKLYELFFPQAYEERLTDVRILSRDDCVDTSSFDKEQDFKYQGLFEGNYKKKLEDTVVSATQLPWTLIIDDDSSYICKGEEKNLIKVEYCHCYISKHLDDLVFRSIHKAFYLRSILGKIFERSSRENIPIAEVAWKIQVNEQVDFSNKRIDYQTAGDLNYYIDGLECFRKNSPGCDFIFPYHPK